MAHKLEHTKGKASHANFVGLPRHVVDSAAFMSLSPLARALYVDLRRQYNGRNNGDISAADGILTRYGWPHSTIHKYLKQLIAHDLIKKTRQGGIASMSRTTSLYAFTDMPVIANPAKGIAGEQASLAYRSFSRPLLPRKQQKQRQSSPREFQDPCERPTADFEIEPAC